MADSMTAADVALLQDRGDMMGGGNAFFWILALLILGGGGFGGFGYGNNRGDFVTQADTANNNYETAQLINNQTNAMLQQNNANLINAIQGFNTVNQNMSAGFAAISNQLSQLGYQMDQCCCKIQTTMLQNRLDDANAALVAANNNISNYNQSQYILGQLGKFVANAPAAAGA